MFFDCDKQVDAKVPVRFRKNAGVKVRSFPSSRSSKEHSGVSKAGAAINEPSKSRRSIKSNGAKLRSLRLAAGLTQEDLAGHVDYSTRLIRKAEMGERLDVKSVRALLKYFVSIGQAVELSELIVAESEDLVHVLPKRWFELVFQQRDFAAAVNLLSRDCLVCMDGISVGAERVEDVVGSLIRVFEETKFSIDYRATRGPWNVMGWTSIRSAGDFKLDDTRGRQLGEHATGDCKQVDEDDICILTGLDASESELFTVCGTTSFRVKQQKIVEIREFSDTALYFPNYYLWLQQQASSQVSQFG